MIILQSILEALIVVLIYGAGFAIFLFSYPRICRFHREWKWKRGRRKRNEQLAKIFEEVLQRERKRKLHEIDKRKYPLFYWRDLIEEKLEDGSI
jgi:hypothetical protein